MTVLQYFDPVTKIKLHNEVIQHCTRDDRVVTEMIGEYDKRQPDKGHSADPNCDGDSVLLPRQYPC